MEWVIYELVYLLFGKLLLTAGGVILNFAINNFVVGFGTQMDGFGLGFVVNTTWAVLRDIFNLAFIFGLVFIGFKMILRIDDANSKRWLVSLILAALLVNFSLFITKFVIDFSNIIAVEMINEGLNTRTNGNTTTVFINLPNDNTGVDISRSMKSVMRLDTSASSQGIPDPADRQNADKPSWGLIFGTMFVFMIGAFVFFAAGILLIVRAAVLILLMIVSPFLFIGMVFPGLNGSAKKLWKMLFTRAFFAPVYITMLYITLRLAGDYMTAVGSGSNLGAALTASGSGNSGDTATIANTFGPFIVVTAFLWITLVASQKIGVEGGNRAVAIGKSIGGAARKRVVGGTRRTAQFAVNQTAGRAARRVSDSAGRRVSRSLNNLQQLEGTTLRGRVARGLARTNAAQDVVGGAAKGMQNAKFGMKRTREEERKMRNATNDRADRGANYTQNQSTPIDERSTAVGIGNRLEARRAQKAQVSDMTNEEILERARTNPQEVMGPEFASLLSDAQTQALADSGVLTNQQVTQLRANRDAGTFADITAVLENENASVENLNEVLNILNQTMKSMSDERLSRMNVDLLSSHEVASRMTDDQFDGLRQSGRVDAEGITNIRNARRDSRITILENGSLANPGNANVGTDEFNAFEDRQRRALFRDAKAAGKMPIEVLGRQSAAEYLTPKIVGEFLNNNPTQNDIDRLRDVVAVEMARDGAPNGYSQGFNNWTEKTVEGRRFGLPRNENNAGAGENAGAEARRRREERNARAAAARERNRR